MNLSVRPNSNTFKEGDIESANWESDLVCAQSHKPLSSFEHLLPRTLTALNARRRQWGVVKNKTKIPQPLFSNKTVFILPLLEYQWPACEWRRTADIFEPILSSEHKGNTVNLLKFQLFLFCLRQSFPPEVSRCACSQCILGSVMASVCWKRCWQVRVNNNSVLSKWK